MKRIQFVVALLIVLALAYVNGKKVRSLSSMEEMENMIETEEAMYKILNNYTEQMAFRLKKLKSYEEEFREAYENSKNGVEANLDNPISSYVFTRRILNTWKEVEKYMSSESSKDLTRIQNDQRTIRTLKRPSNEDLTMAANELKKLQATYQLSAKDMAEGAPYGIKLNSGDCFELGRGGYEEKQYESAYDWLQQAWALVDDGRSSEDDVLEYLAAVAYLSGKIRRAHDLSEVLLKRNPKHAKVNNNMKHYKKRLAEIAKVRDTALQKDIVHGILNWQEEDLNQLVENVCDGEIRPSNRSRAKLRCKYTDKNIAYLKIAPFKEEEIFKDPPVFLYHDVLSDGDIAKLLTSAEVLTNSTSTPMYEVRTNKLGIKLDDRIPEALIQRSADFTGFQKKSIDSIPSSLRGKTNLSTHEVMSPTVLRAGWKMATVRFFLDDTTGGETVFPSLKLRVDPEKKAALVWFNLRRSGAADDLTLNGLCRATSSGPHRDATIAVRTFGNEFRRPCGISERS